MSISARNVFKGEVSKLAEGSINAEVEITMAGGITIVAVLTQTSVKALALAVGVQAIALVKAPWVTLLSGKSQYRFSARNQLKGTVSRIIKGAVNSQVELALPGGLTVFAVVTNDAVSEMQLAEGTPATGMFKASHVLVGVPT